MQLLSFVGACSTGLVSEISQVLERLRIQKFITDTQGSIAIVTALSIVVLVIASGMAIDYAVMIRQRAELQAAADAGAIAGAKEIFRHSTGANSRRQPRSHKHGPQSGFAGRVQRQRRQLRGIGHILKDDADSFIDGVQHQQRQPQQRCEHHQ